MEAKLGFKAHPHMLRQACGFALASRGHDIRAPQAYLGHRNIQHAARYTDQHPIGSRASGDDVAAPLFGVRSQISFVDADSLLTHKRPPKTRTSGPAQNAGPFSCR